MARIAQLTDRCVLEMSGADRVAFLQGLVSNDVELVKPGAAIWTGFLTPQGRYLADFFIADGGDRLLIDIARDQAGLVRQKLMRFRLRNQVAIEESDRAVYVVWDGLPEGATDGIGFEDPRLPGSAYRVLGGSLTPNEDEADWDRYRLSIGLPSEKDMEPEKTLLLEAGFDELHGVSWTKGCYMGQELTARTKYRGLVKKRLMPVRIEGDLPAIGTPVLQDGAEVGTMRSGRAGMGMATLRLDAVERASPLSCGMASVNAWRPAWMVEDASV